MRLPEVLADTVPVVCAEDEQCAMCRRPTFAMTPVPDGLVCFVCATGRWLALHWFGVPQ